jgi:hypothetical protein
VRCILQAFGRIGLVGSLLIALSAPLMFTQQNGQAQAAPPATAEYVPSDAVLFVSIETSILSRQWLQAGVLAERLELDVDPAAVAVGLLQQAFASDVSIDVTPFLGGELALIFLNAGVLFASSDPVDTVLDPAESVASAANGLVILALPSDLAAAEAELRAALEQEAADRGVGIEETTYRDTPISSVPGNAASGIAGVSMAVVGEAVVLGVTASQFEPIIDRAAGDNEPISSIEGFDAALAAMPDDRIALGLLNGPALFAQRGATEGIGPAIEALIPGGANGVTAFSVASQADGFRVDTRTVSGDGQPIRTFGDHFESELFERLPAETQVAVSGTDFADTRLLDGVFSILFTLVSDVFVDSGLEATPGPALSSLDETADAAYEFASALLGMDFEANFADLLDGEFLAAVWNAGGPDSDPAVGFVSESSDAATIDQTLSSISLAASFFLGATTSTSPTGATRIELGGGPLDIDVVGDYLVVGYGGAGAALLEAPTSSLQDSPLYQAVTAPLPQDRSLMIFINIEAIESGAVPARPRGLPGLTRTVFEGPAFAFVTFNDGDEMGGQGFLYVPEPD